MLVAHIFDSFRSKLSDIAFDYVVIKVTEIFTGLSLKTIAIFI